MTKLFKWALNDSAGLNPYFVNGTITTTVAANALTIVIKTLAGADPSTSDPVRCWFPTNGGTYQAVDITAATSLTIASGATMGWTNGLAQRLWVALFNDAGTVRIAVRTCTSPAAPWSIVAPIEGVLASSTLTPGNSAHTFYTTGAAVTSKAWFWVAWMSWETPLTTAGTWASIPNHIVLVSANSARPGTVIQRVQNAGAGALGLTSTTTATVALSQSVTPLSACSYFQVSAFGYIYLRTGATNQQGTGFLALNSFSILGQSMNAFTVDSTDSISSGAASAICRPNSTSAQTFAVYAQNVTASGLINYSFSDLIINELMT